MTAMRIGVPRLHQPVTESRLPNDRPSSTSGRWPRGETTTRGQRTEPGRSPSRPRSTARRSTGSRPSWPPDRLPTSATLVPPTRPVLVVDVDPLLADLLGHPLLAGHGVLVEPDPLPGHDPLLDHRAGHGVIGRRSRGVPSHLGGPDRVPVGRDGPVNNVVVEAVVAPQLPLLGLRQVPVGVGPGRVLDQLLVVGDEDVVVALEGLGEGDEAGLGAEQAGVDQGPFGLAGLVVEVDGVDGADAAAVPVQQGAAFPGTDSVHVGHLSFIPFGPPRCLLLAMTYCGVRHDADPRHQRMVESALTLWLSYPSVPTAALGRSAPDGWLAAGFTGGTGGGRRGYPPNRPTRS